MALEGSKTQCFSPDGCSRTERSRCLGIIAVRSGLFCLSLNCFVQCSRIQLSPSISSGPTNQPEDAYSTQLPSAVASTAASFPRLPASFEAGATLTKAATSVRMLPACCRHAAVAVSSSRQSPRRSHRTQCTHAPTQDTAGVRPGFVLR